MLPNLKFETRALVSGLHQFRADLYGENRLFMTAAS